MKKTKSKTSTWRLGTKAQAKSYIDVIHYLECPYCKKVVFLANPELCKTLKKWRKQIKGRKTK